jgi:hypothetical protein
MMISGPREKTYILMKKELHCTGPGFLHRKWRLFKVITLVGMMKLGVDLCRD